MVSCFFNGYLWYIFGINVLLETSSFGVSCLANLLKGFGNFYSARQIAPGDHYGIR